MDILSFAAYILCVANRLASFFILRVVRYLPDACFSWTAEQPSFPFLVAFESGKNVSHATRFLLLVYYDGSIDMNVFRKIGWKSLSMRYGNKSTFIDVVNNTVCVDGATEPIMFDVLDLHYGK